MIDASPSSVIRGKALPVLLSLASKPVFLHDDSVHNLAKLPGPERGKASPHPFYVVTLAQPSQAAAHLKSRDNDSK